MGEVLWRVVGFRLRRSAWVVGFVNVDEDTLTVGVEGPQQEKVQVGPRGCQKWVGGEIPGEVMDVGDICFAVRPVFVQLSGSLIELETGEFVDENFACHTETVLGHSFRQVAEKERLKKRIYGSISQAALNQARTFQQFCWLHKIDVFERLIQSVEWWKFPIVPIIEKIFRDIVTSEERKNIQDYPAFWTEFVYISEPQV